MKNVITITVLLTALVVAGAGVYYTHSLYIVRGGEATVSYTIQADASVGSPTSTSVGVGVVPDAPASAGASSLQSVAQGMRRYTNPAYHFSLVVPDTLQVQE